MSEWDDFRNGGSVDGEVRMLREMEATGSAGVGNEATGMSDAKPRIPEELRLTWEQADLGMHDALSTQIEKNLFSVIRNQVERMARQMERIAVLTEQVGRLSAEVSIKERVKFGIAENVKAIIEALLAARADKPQEGRK
jgi:hypothetical protein